MPLGGSLTYATLLLHFCSIISYSGARGEMRSIGASDAAAERASRKRPQQPAAHFQHQTSVCSTAV